MLNKEIDWQNALESAKSWYSEMQNIKADSFDNGKTLSLFVSNGKGDDGLWIQISKEQVFEAADMYHQAKMEQISDEYAHFEMDKPASAEQEIAFAKHLLENDREQDARMWICDDELVDNIKEKLKDETAQEQIQKVRRR